jgi:hygromycin-B 7''-O-kinase
MSEPDPFIAFTDSSYYSAHFMDVAIWEPYVRLVCRRHSLDCARVDAGVPGTFPTFICSASDLNTHRSTGSTVVKFFGPLFKGRASFDIEQVMGQLLEQHALPIPSPQVLAAGELQNGWCYLVFACVPGVSIGEVRQAVQPEDWLSVARQMGYYIHCLHVSGFSIHPALSAQIDFSPKAYASHLRQQRQQCLHNHRTWNDLPQLLLAQLDDFLLPVEQLADPGSSPHLVHADLTADHLLGRLANGKWHTHAIIDWGDASAGSILNELIPIFVDMFRGDQQLLRAFLEEYDLPGFYHAEFPRKALCTLLLASYPVPSILLEPCAHVHSLHELAQCLFGV